MIETHDNKGMAMDTMTQPQPLERADVPTMKGQTIFHQVISGDSLSFENLIGLITAHRADQGVVIFDTQDRYFDILGKLGARRAGFLHDGRWVEANDRPEHTSTLYSIIEDVVASEDVAREPMGHREIADSNRFHQPLIVLDNALTVIDRMGWALSWAIGQKAIGADVVLVYEDELDIERVPRALTR